MRPRTLAVPAAAAIGVLAGATAAAAIWLALREPVLVADAVAAGDPGPLLRTLIAGLLEVFRTLIEYL